MYTSGMPKGPEEPQHRLPSLDFAACAEHCIGAGQLQGKPRDLGLCRVSQGCIKLAEGVRPSCQVLHLFLYGVISCKHLKFIRSYQVI